MTVVVIGGGAAGMMAAIVAGTNNDVILLERQSRLGRKLLATGNGRCNLSNTNAAVEHYHGDSPAFAESALRGLTAEDTLEYFRYLGLVTTQEADGRVYPYSDRANSVVDVLRFAVESCADVRTGCEVSRVERLGGGFKVTAGDAEFLCDRVIIACGGSAGTKLGGTGMGYELLKQLGHTCTKLKPALVQLKTDNTYTKSLKGVRAAAVVKLFDGEKVVCESTGEVQFTEFGISGPAVFEISRAAAVSERKLTAALDMMHEFDESEIVAMLQTRQYSYPHMTLENLLTGFVQNNLGRTLIRYSGLSLGTAVSELEYRELRRIAAAVKDFRMEVTGTMGMEHAQVTAGGIRTSEFDARTLQSRVCPGVYACGEVLDIDGDCGGYNLQWAWSSGYLAGELRE